MYQHSASLVICFILCDKTGNILQIKKAFVDQLVKLFVIVVVVLFCFGFDFFVFCCCNHKEEEQTNRHTYNLINSLSLQPILEQQS